MDEITLFDVLGVLAFVGTLVIGAILATRRGEPLDDAVTARFDNTTRPEIERNEPISIMFDEKDKDNG